MTTILVVDDEWMLWKGPLTQAFAGHRLIFESSPDRVVPVIRQHPDISAVLLDLHFPGERLQGRDILNLIKYHDADLPVFIFTARDETKLAMTLTDKGRGPAADYFVKDDPRTDFVTEVTTQAEHCTANRAVVTTNIVFSDRERRITVGNISFDIKRKGDYALYRMIALAAKEQWVGVGPGGIGPEHKGWLAISDFYSIDSRASQALLDISEITLHGGSWRTDDPLRKALKGGKGSMQTRISESRSRLKGLIENQLVNPKQLERFRVHDAPQRIEVSPVMGEVSVQTFGMVVPPDQIMFDYL